MKVAAVQFAPKFAQFDANLRTVMTLVEAAASHQAELIVLPELCLSGYSFLSEQEARPLSEVLADDQGGPKRSFARMRTLASSLDIAIAWGLIESDPNSGKLHNTQVLMLPTGEWSSYRKVNSWGNDYIWATEGTASPPVTEFRGKKIGLLICADVADKSSAIDDFYEKGDADIVAFSANWGDGGFPAGRWVKFAKSNGCHLVVSNRYGQEQNNNFGEGGICIIDPQGKVHCEGLRWSNPCIVYGDV